MIKRARKSGLGHGLRHWLRRIPAYALAGLVFWLPALSGTPAGFRLLYQSQNLQDYKVAAECNPGGTTQCPCRRSDVRVTAQPDYGEVTANVRARSTFVNAIANHKFHDEFSPGRPIVLGTYAYAGEFALPDQPLPQIDKFDAPQGMHVMMQWWDGRNSRYTREAVIYWELNPWEPDFGEVRVYTGQPPQLLDTGLTIKPDTQWHSFRLVANFATEQYESVTVDGQTRDLQADLARAYHPDWQHDFSFIVTAESMNAWPGDGCGRTFGWTTRFRSMTLWQQYPVVLPEGLIHQ